MIVVKREESVSLQWGCWTVLSVVTSVSCALKIFLGHIDLKRDCEDEHCTLYRNSLTLCPPHSHTHKQQSLLPSAIYDPVIPWIMHLNERQHPRVLTSPTLLEKEMKGGEVVERYPRWWGVHLFFPCSHWKPALNTRRDTCTCCYQFFCSPMWEWEEAEKKGSDKEKGRERRRRKKRAWGRSMCVRETRASQRRKMRGGWKELYGAVIFSPAGWCLSSWWLCLSFVRSPCVPRSRQPYTDQHRAGDESAPTKSLWDGSVCFCLEGGTHQAFPGKRQPAVCARLRASPPHRCVYERESAYVCVWEYVCADVSKWCITVYLSVYSRTLASNPSRRREALLFAGRQGKGDDFFFFWLIQWFIPQEPSFLSLQRQGENGKGGWGGR